MRNKNVYYFIYIIFAIFMLLNVVVTPLFVLFTYNAYEGETTAIVEHVESRRSRRHRRYQVTYSYAVDDVSYRNTSPFGRGARGEVGQIIIVRYDSENPETVITSLEIIHAKATLMSGAIVGGTVIIISVFNHRKRRKSRTG